MYVIMLNYVKPLADVDRVLPEHVEFLKEQYARGNFLLSGRKVPRSGGVIMAKSMPLKEIKGILKSDPFCR